MSRSKPWKKLYHNVRWYRTREYHLRKNPLCAYCYSKGTVTAATVVDHVVPHRGDPAMFWKGELQSMCEFHHSSSKQREEYYGYSTEIGIDGLPVDPKHPHNRE